MTLSLAEWAKYRDLLTKLSQTAADEFRNAIWDANGKFGGVGLGNIPREDVIEYAYALVTKYGEGSAELACQMYDAMAEVSGMHLAPAVPAETASLGEVGRVINGTINVSQTPDYVASTVGRLVKQASQDTTLQNALRDGAQFAWIPSGDTCPFCIMLASRGWQYVSKKALKKGHAEHIHSNCNCAYAIRFDEKTKVAGYDPDQYLEVYQNAEGNTWKEKLNSMRREQLQDPAIRAKVNAQKRAAYAASRERELLTHNLPKGFVDTRIIGNAISSEELDRIASYAEEHGIKFVLNGRNIGFDEYRGNPEVLQGMVEQFANGMQEYGIPQITLEYGNVLGYQGDPSKIDIGAFAETNGTHIKLNKFMFDDSGHLERTYNENVGFFPFGTSYLNVADHELGHIVARNQPWVYNRAIDELQRLSENANMSIEEYVKGNISEYASFAYTNEVFAELIPELNAMAHGSITELALMLLGRG